MTIGSHNAIVNPFADGSSASSADPPEPPSSKSDVLSVGKHATLTLGTDDLTILERKTSRTVPFYNVLSADLSENDITIKYAEPMSKSHVTVGSVHYPIDLEQKSKAEAWVAKLLQLSYGEAKRNKKLKVLINPFGGKGMAPTYYSRFAEPILAAAGCDIDVEETTHRGHATDIAEKIDVDAYDALVACSGDGLPYEIFNGLAKKPNAREALAKIAVGMIPSGSGNGMAMNLYGSPSVSLAALAIVKGKRMPLDLVSITQGDTRTLSFLSQSFGIVAECDLGTDNIRWMGPHRFTYGFLVRLMGKTVWPCDVALKVEMDDKQAIKDHYRAEIQKKPQLLSDKEAANLPKGLPPLRYGTVNDKIPDDWERIPGETMGNFYAGNMAWMSSDANFFPAALPNDGLLDLVTIDGTIPRLKSLSMLLAVEDGSIFDIPEARFRKVSAYRLVPKQTEGYISIDGESVPFAPIQVEVHKGLGTVLSVSGNGYAAKGPPGTET
ncbi:sphinganine kinase lcb4 [Paecilomyces lecythidis]|uniref:Sphinganine kinase lcb4 n=1 Tax=Paecilomyces lecythidis TaxID=3004212 RepID=A0ABR3YCP2_9EURO